MITIYKYRLKTDDIQRIQLPCLREETEILCIQMQNGIPCLWIKVNDWSNNKDELIIYTYGTGNRIEEENIDYIGTYQAMGLVFHVFNSAL